MTTRFIHTADWQIAKPFANFDPGLAGELAAARLSVISRIGVIARAHGATHVLVAGDVFDRHGIDTNTLRRVLQHLRQEESLTWVLLPGNHDFAQAGVFWDRLQRLGFPQNVVALTTNEPFAVSPEAVVLPAPLTSRNPGHDPSAWMDGAATPPGVLRVGLAHGSVQGFGSEGECSVAIARDRAERAGLAYLALGDWHGTKEIGKRTWYSGTPEPDRFKSNDAGHVLAVTLDGSHPPHVKAVRSAEFDWRLEDRQIRTLDDLEPIDVAVSALANSASRVLMSLTLSGALTLGDYARFEEWRQKLEGRLRYLACDTDGLAVLASDLDLESLGSETALHEAARDLAAQAADPENPAQAAAALALRRLVAFAAEDREMNA